LVPYSQDRAPDALRAIATVPIFVDYKLSRRIAGGPLFKAKF
jgi:hypothetical protein